MTHQVIHDVQVLQLSTLAAGSVLTANTKLDAARGQGFKLDKLQLGVTWKDHVAQEGPLQFGLARGPITAAEIAECLNADPQGENDIPAAEQANRRVVPYGLIEAGLNAVPANVPWFRSIRFPWKQFAENETLQFWVKNIDGAALTSDWQIFFTIAAVTDWDL